MEISNMLLRKTMSNRTRLQFSITWYHDYDQKAEKTIDRKLMFSYMCSPETATKQFEISKKIYTQLTGRKQFPDHNVIMYQVIQQPAVKQNRQKEMTAVQYSTSHKERLCQTIDWVFPDRQSCDDFLAKMWAEGYKTKEGIQLEGSMAEVTQLSEQYAALLAEKWEQYAEYKMLRQDMIAYQTAKQNVNKILGLVPEELEQNRGQKPERCL